MKSFVGDLSYTLSTRVGQVSPKWFLRFIYEFGNFYFFSPLLLANENFQNRIFFNFFDLTFWRYITNRKRVGHESQLIGPKLTCSKHRETFYSKFTHVNGSMEFWPRHYFNDMS